MKVTAHDGLRFGFHGVRADDHEHFRCIGRCLLRILHLVRSSCLSTKCSGGLRSRSFCVCRGVFGVGSLEFFCFFGVFSVVWRSV